MIEVYKYNLKGDDIVDLFNHTTDEKWSVDEKTAISLAFDILKKCNVSLDSDTFEKLSKFPSMLSMNNKTYNLNIHKAKEDGNFNGWWCVEYITEDEIDDPKECPIPEVRDINDGSGYFLVAFTTSFAEVVDDMYERLINCGIIENKD